jgi:hypothetical protein
MAGRSFTAEQNVIVRAAVRELLERYGSQPKLAAALEIKQPSLSNYLLGRFDAGPHLARKAAELKGMTVDELLGLTRTVEPPDRYPNRMEAVRVARKDGLPEAAIQVVLSAVLQSEDDLSIIDWIDAIRDEVRRQRRFAGEEETVKRVRRDAARATTPSVDDEEGAVTRHRREKAGAASDAKAVRVPADRSKA